MSILEVKDETPLKWPEDRPRTRFQDRESKPAWKLSYQDAFKGLERELKLLKATFALVTHNPLNHDDGGVALWLSRKAVDDYGWQDAFGFVGVIPTAKEVGQAYRERAQKVHPDGPTPNRVAFDELTKHRDNAMKWIQGRRSMEPETVMAVDTFKEVRHNLNAIKLTLSALRQIERCGSPVMMEQAFRGFRPALAAKGVTEDASATA